MVGTGTLETRAAAARPARMSFGMRTGSVRPRIRGLGPYGDRSPATATRWRRWSASCTRPTSATLIEDLESEERPRLIALLGRDFDFAALTEVDDAVREEILEEVPNEADRRGRARS
jgi:magnesium transporter